MDDELIVVSVRMPRSLSDRAKAMANRQDRTVQAVFMRAVRLGLDQEEARERIACDAIKAAERRPPSNRKQPRSYETMTR